MDFLRYIIKIFMFFFREYKNVYVKITKVYVYLIIKRGCVIQTSYKR